MSSLLNSKESLIGRLKRGRATRNQFVDSHLAKNLAFQIRATRDKLGWNQEKLATEAGMTQHAISRLESPGYGKLTLTTLKRLAAAMDVGLVVRFVPFSELVDWVSGTPRIIGGLTASALAVSCFDREQSECALGKSDSTMNIGFGAAEQAVQSAEGHFTEHLGNLDFLVGKQPQRRNSSYSVPRCAAEAA